MSALQVDWEIEQGATFVYAFQWLTPGVDANTPGPPHNLTGYVARMQMRKKQGQPILVDASSTNGKIILGENLDGTVTGDLTSGWIKVVLSDDDTDLLTSSKVRFDLEVESGTGTVYRLIKGTATVDPNITQEIDDPTVTD